MPVGNQPKGRKPQHGAGRKAPGQKRGGSSQLDAMQTKQDLLQHLTRQAEINTRILERERAQLLALEIQSMERAHTENGGLAEAPPFFTVPQSQDVPYSNQHPPVTAAAVPAHGPQLPPLAAKPPMVVPLPAQLPPQQYHEGSQPAYGNHLGRTHMFMDQPATLFSRNQVPGLSDEPMQPYSPFREADGPGAAHAPTPGPNRTFPDSPGFYPGMVFGVPMHNDDAPADVRPYSPTRHAGPASRAERAPTPTRQGKRPQAVRLNIQRNQAQGSKPQPSKLGIGKAAQSAVKPAGKQQAGRQRRVSIQEPAQLVSLPAENSVPAEHLDPFSEHMTRQLSGIVRQQEQQNMLGQNLLPVSQPGMQGRQDASPYAELHGIAAPRAAHGPQHVSAQAAEAARKQAYRLELDEQIRAKKERQAAEKRAAMQQEMAAEARATAQPPPWDPAAVRRGGGGDPLRDVTGAPVADLRYAGARPVSGLQSVQNFADQGNGQSRVRAEQQAQSHLTIELPSDPAQPEGSGMRAFGWQQQGGNVAPGYQPQVQAHMPARPGDIAQHWTETGMTGQPQHVHQNQGSPGGQNSPGGRRFMAAMAQLVAGPSEEQLRHKEAQRAALLRDLDEQVRQKKEREARNKAEEAYQRQKEERELSEHYQRMQAAKDEDRRAQQQQQTIQQYQQQQQQQQAPDVDVHRVQRRGAARKLVDAHWLGSSAEAAPGRPVLSSISENGAASARLQQSHAWQPSETQGADRPLPQGSEAQGLNRMPHQGPEAMQHVLQQLQAEQARLLEDMAHMSSLHQAAQQVSSDRQRAWQDMQRARGRVSSGGGAPHHHVLPTLQEDSRAECDCSTVHLGDTLPPDQFVISTHLLPRDANSIPTRLCTPLEAEWAAEREPLIVNKGVWQSEQPALYEDTAELEDALRPLDQFSGVQQWPAMVGGGPHTAHGNTRQGLFRPLSRIEGAPPSRLPQAPVRAAWPPLGQPQQGPPASRYKSFYNLDGTINVGAKGAARLPPLQHAPNANAPAVAFGRRAAGRPPPSPAILRADLLLPSPDRKPHPHSAAPQSSRADRRSVASGSVSARGQHSRKPLLPTAARAASKKAAQAKVLLQQHAEAGAADVTPLE